MHRLHDWTIVHSAGLYLYVTMHVIVQSCGCMSSYRFSAGLDTFALCGAYQAHGQASDATVAWSKCGRSSLRCEGNNDLMPSEPATVSPARTRAYHAMMHLQLIVMYELLCGDTSVPCGM